ncbi:MAG: sodium:solute symporter [Planctomycetota bacterium]
MLSGVDLAIVIGFLVLVTVVGYMLSKVASEGIESYFLGGNKIPWWLLGVSTATSNFDMSGTMVIVAMVFALGYKGFLVEIRGGVGLSLAFLVVFLAKWLRRSRVMTSAEWMKLRFGTDEQGKTAHLVSTIVYLVLSVGMIAYFAEGAGKFLVAYMPPEWVQTEGAKATAQFLCTTGMVLIGLFYTLMSGLYGVVFTDVIQMVLLTFTAIYISVKGFAARSAVEVLPEGFFDLDLESPAAGLGQGLLSGNPEEWTPIFGMFGLCVLCWVLRTTLEGFGGVGGYTDQRFFAARSEREASLIGLEAIVLSMFRWTMVAGLVVLGYALVQKGGSVGETIAADPENVLPYVFGEYLPSGIRGLVIAGMIAAAMSTFDSTLNAGAAYFVKDLYHSYINQEATPAQLMSMSRWATIGLCVLGVASALVIPDINTIWGFITMGLGMPMFIPLCLRWYWPRFNGYGFSVSLGIGVITGIVINAGLHLPIYWGVPVTVVVVSVAAVVTTYLTAPTKENVLVNFAIQIDPWGFWGRYLKIGEERGLVDRTYVETSFGKKMNDVLAVFFVLPFQLALLLGGMSLIFHDWVKFGFFMCVLGVSVVGMYFFWWRNLDSEEEAAEDDKIYEPLPSGWGEIDEYVEAHASGMGRISGMGFVDEPPRETSQATPTPPSATTATPPASEPPHTEAPSASESEPPKPTEG